MSPSPSSGFGESTYRKSPPLRDRVHEVDQDLDEPYFLPFGQPRCSHENFASSETLEILPLLRRSSINLERGRGRGSAGTRRCSTSESDDEGGKINDSEPLLRVQSGVKKAEAITMLWTRTSLIVAYVS